MYWKFILKLLVVKFKKSDIEKTGLSLNNNECNNSDVNIVPLFINKIIILT